METFRNVFDSWISKKTNKQIKEIDKICLKLNIDPTEWFNEYTSSRSLGEYVGIDFLKEMLSSFIFYVSKKFDEPIKKLLPIKGYNIYKEPIYGVLTELSYDHKDGFYFTKSEKMELKELLKTFTIEQKEELMEDRIFSHIILQTKFKLFSKREIRALKLKKIKKLEL